jgi:WD40 repeat protein
VSFAPDGRRALSGSFDRTVRLWDVETGREVSRWTAADQVWTVAFSPDGRHLAASGYDASIDVWAAPP